jgi:VWFA-related protein
LLLAAGPAPRPGALKGQERAIVDRIEVRVVNVDAVVLDKKGSPVRGLGPADFLLTEDGREVEISHFFAYGDGPVRAGRPPAPTPEEQPEQASTGLGLEPLTLALYLDDRALKPADRARVLQDVRAWLQEWPERQQVMLMVSRERLHVVVEPTSDPAAVLAALEDWERAPARSLEPLLDERRARDAIVTSYEACEMRARGPQPCVPCIDNWEEMLSYAEQFAHGAETRSAIAISGLADVVGALSGLAGRKVVLYVGGGFEQRPGIAMLTYVADVCADRRSDADREVYAQLLNRNETTARLNQLTAYANGNRVQIFALDSAGLATPTASSVEFARAIFAPAAKNDQIRIANLQNTLYMLADETGGRAILNANRPLDELVRIHDELESGYSLGFVPDHPPSGSVHLLKVELVGKAARGNTVRYRRTYQDKALEARLADRLLSALYLEPKTNPLGARVAALESRQVGRRQHEVPVMVSVPADSLLRLPNAPGVAARPGQVRLVMVAQGEDGRRTELRQELIELGIGGVEPEQGRYDFVVRMLLPEGRQTVAVVVRDELTQQESIVRSELEVPVIGAPP